MHRDSIAVRREGAAQVALVGPPNVGKSSLLQALSEIQIRTGDYAFTTLRPVPALTRIGGVLVQLVEIPGLIEGANEDRGGGRALLGVLRSADAIVYCARAGAPTRASCAMVLDEVAAAEIDKPAFVAATRADEADRARSSALAAAFPDSACCRSRSSTRPRSTAFRDEVWRLTGLIRVYLRANGSTDEEPLALHPPATVVDVADARPPRAGRRVHRRPRLGPVGEVRRPARRPRPRGRRRRRRGGARLIALTGRTAASLISIPIDMYRR